MRVDDERGAQDSVRSRVQRASRKGSNGQGHEAGSEESLEGPVVVAV